MFVVLFPPASFSMRKAKSTSFEEVAKGFLRTCHLDIGLVDSLFCFLHFFGFRGFESLQFLGSSLDCSLSMH